MVRYAMAAMFAMLAAGEARGDQIRALGSTFFFVAEDGLGSVATGSMKISSEVLVDPGQYGSYEINPYLVLDFEAQRIMIPGSRSAGGITNSVSGLGPDRLGAQYFSGYYPVFQLVDVDGTVFESKDFLPTTFDLDQFEVKSLTFSTDLGRYFAGTFTWFSVTPPIGSVVVPEPSTLALIGPAALLGLSAWRWRRRKAA